MIYKETPMQTAAKKSRPIVALLVLLSLTAFASPWQSLRAEDAPKPEEKAADWSVAPLLPPETLFVVTSPDSKKMTDKFKQTGLWQLYSNPDVQKAFRTPLMAAQMGMAAAELQAGIKIPEILSWINQGEVTFAMLACDHRNEKDEPVPDLLISLQAKEKTQAVLDEISKRIDQLNANAGNQLDLTQTPVGNYTVHRVGHVAVPFSISYTVCDGQIIVTLGEGYIEKILTLHEKLKAGPLPAAANGKPETLAQTPAFLATTRKSSDADLIAFANWDLLRDNKILNFKPHNDRVQADWDLVGLDAVHAMSYALSVKGQSLREVLYVDTPAAARKGMLALFDGAAPLNPTVLAQAPRNSVLAVALDFAPDKFSDKLAELASIDNPNARQELDQALTLAGQQLKVDVKKEIFGALTGQATFSVAMVAKNAKLPVAMPQALLTIQVKDTNALKTVLASVRNALGEKFEYSETAANNNSIVTVREKFPQGHKPRQIAYAIDKSDLLVSLYPLALRDELARRQGAGSPSDKARSAGSLSEDDDFKNAMSSISGTPQFLFYADTGAIATAAYDILIPIAQLEPRPPQLDVSVLPSADLLAQNLTGTVFSLNSDSDGVTASGYSPTGVVGLFAVTVSAAIKNRQNAGGGVGGAGGGAMQQRKRSVLDALNQGLQAYAKDNNGAFPHAVKDLQPKYLPQLTTELNFVEYLGKQDKENKVVAHSSEKLPGPITVLLQNGTVADIRRESLGKTLKEGFNADAAVTEAPKQAPDF